MSDSEHHSVATRTVLAARQGFSHAIRTRIATATERGTAVIDLILRVVLAHAAATLLVTHDRSHLHLMDGGSQQSNPPK